MYCTQYMGTGLRTNRFHTNFPVPVPVSVPCSVNEPLHLSHTWVTPESHLSYTTSITSEHHVNHVLLNLLTEGIFLFLCENITSWSYSTWWLAAVWHSQFNRYPKHNVHFQIRGAGGTPRPSFLYFHAVFEKKDPTIGWRPLLWYSLDLSFDPSIRQYII